MGKKTGHIHSIEPYPWDEAKNRASSALWICCDMNLSSSFYVCPICEKERIVNQADDDL